MKKRQIPLSCGVPGTETVLTAFEYGPQQAPRKVYIQASLHADELPGSLVAWQLCQQLQELEAQQRISSQIVVVPLCNPLGLRQSVMYSQIGRFDLATGQNYNRLRGIDFLPIPWHACRPKMRLLWDRMPRITARQFVRPCMPHWLNRKPPMNCKLCT